MITAIVQYRLPPTIDLAAPSKPFVSQEPCPIQTAVDELSHSFDKGHLAPAAVHGDDNRGWWVVGSPPRAGYWARSGTVRKGHFGAEGPRDRSGTATKRSGRQTS